MKMYSKQYKTLNGAQQFVKLLKQKEKNDIQICEFPLSSDVKIYIVIWFE